MSRRQIHYLTAPEIESLKARVKNWGGICILCGDPFRSLLSVTRDHVTPKCLLKKGEKGFCAATHYRCNNFRQHNSLIQTAKKLADLKLKWGREMFSDWVNKKVPCRKVEPGINISL